MLLIIAPTSTSRASSARAVLFHRTVSRNGDPACLLKHVAMPCQKPLANSVTSALCPDPAASGSPICDNRSPPKSGSTHYSSPRISRPHKYGAFVYGSSLRPACGPYSIQGAYGIQIQEVVALPMALPGIMLAVAFKNRGCACKLYIRSLISRIVLSRTLCGRTHSITSGSLPAIPLRSG